MSSEGKKMRKNEPSTGEKIAKILDRFSLSFNKFLRKNKKDGMIILD